MNLLDFRTAHPHDHVIVPFEAKLGALTPVVVTAVLDRTAVYHYPETPRSRLLTRLELLFVEQEPKVYVPATKADEVRDKESAARGRRLSAAKRRVA